MSGADLHLMDLPHDVLSSVPLIGVGNSPFGEAPMDALGVLFNTFTSTMVGAGEFLYNGLVATVSFMIELATALVDIGMKVVASYLEAVQAVIEAVVEVAELIVDAMNALIDWVIEFIEETLNAIFNPIINTIQNMCDSYCSKVYAACVLMRSDIENTGSASESSNRFLLGSIMGDLFLALAGITTIAILALTILSVVTGPAGFLTSFIISTIVSLIVVTAISAAIATLDHFVDIGQALYDITVSMLTWSGATITQGDLLSTMIDGLIFMFDLIGLGAIFYCPGMSEGLTGIGLGLACAVAGVILSVWSVGLVDDGASMLLDVVALMLCVYALASSASNLIKVYDMRLANSSPLMILILTSIISLSGFVKSAYDIGEYLNE